MKTLPVIGHKPMIGSIVFTRLSPERWSHFKGEGQEAIRIGRDVVQQAIRVGCGVVQQAAPELENDRDVIIQAKSYDRPVVPFTGMR